MEIYLLIVLIVFIVAMNSNWDSAHNRTGSKKFKWMFNLISALIWPVFLVTLVLDFIIALYWKIRTVWKF